MEAPALATLRITDCREDKAMAPAVKSRDFQHTVKEAHANPDLVTGMVSIYYLPSFACYAYVHDVMFKDVLSERIVYSDSF